MPITIPHTLQNVLQTAPGNIAWALKQMPSGRTFIHNATPMPSASLIKVFIMIEAFRQAEKGLLDLQRHTAITPEVQVGGAGPLQDASLGTEVPNLELIRLMITESDNTATNMLIDQLGFDAINQTIGRLGCQHTLLQRRMMDFTAAAAGRDNTTSVTDMLLCLERLYHKDCLGETLDQQMIDILKQQTDREKIPALLPPVAVVANKTGELDGVEHDAAIIYTPNFDYLIVVMTTQQPDAEVAKDVTARLSKAVYDILSTRA